MFRVPPYAADERGGEGVELVPDGEAGLPPSDDHRLERLRLIGNAHTAHLAPCDRDKRRMLAIRCDSIGEVPYSEADLLPVAYAAASARLRRPSLDSTLPTWCSTVLRVM